MTTHQKTMNSPSLSAQQYIDYLGKYLGVKYEVLDNTNDNRTYRWKLTLSNGGQTPVAGWHDWAIYFFSFTMPEQERMKEVGFSVGVPVHDGQLHVRHIQGYFYELKPTKIFKPIHSGNEIEVDFLGARSMVARTDQFPNWYVACDGAKPRILESTMGESLDFIGKFDQPKIWKRRMADLYDPYTPDVRFEKHHVEDLGGAGCPIVPTPLQYNQKTKGSVAFTADTNIVYTDASFKQEASYLADKLKLPVQEGSSSSAGKQSILLKLGKVPDLNFDGKVHKTFNDSYSLNVSAEGIVITASASAGLLYGIQSLLSLVENKQVPYIDIVDAPRYPYRGFMLDVCRNFYPVKEIKRILDVLAKYKLNKLHLHLSEDEAWRIEIPGLPELTKIGGKRGHDLKEESCLLPQLGSGPDTEGLGSGYFTVEDYREILKYANKLHIQVIPEIDMPGHCHAAIKAMEARQRNLLKEGKSQEEANRFMISDLEDKSEYASPQRFTDGALNPCVPTVYNFVEHVMAEIVKMHQDIQPLQTFHLGGDEVPMGAFTDSPACRHFMEKHPEVKTPHDIKEYFLREVGNLADKHKLNIQAWEDGFYAGHLNETATKLTPRTSFPSSRDVTANFWVNIMDYGRMHEGHELANNDYKVVLSYGTHLYFDHPQEPDPEERGLYWATRYIDTQKVYQLVAGDVYDNIDADQNGLKTTREHECGPDGRVKCVPLKKPENIIGIQAQVWTEVIRTTEQLHSMLLPRLLATAERGWHFPHWETLPAGEERDQARRQGWTQFANSLGYREMGWLEDNGYSPYLPVPGARFVDGKLETCTSFPGLVVQCSVDGGQTWTDVPQDFSLDRSKPVMLATRPRNSSKRRSRHITIPALK